MPLPTDAAPSAQAVSIAALIKQETGTLVSRQVLPTLSGNPPTFSISFDPTLIDPAATYVVVGAVVDGATVWESAAGVPAIVGGAATGQVDVPLVLTTAAIPIVTPAADGPAHASRRHRRRRPPPRPRRPRAQRRPKPRARPPTPDRRPDADPRPDGVTHAGPDPDPGPDRLADPGPDGQPHGTEPVADRLADPGRIAGPAERRPDRDAGLSRVVPAVGRCRRGRRPRRGQGQGTLEPDRRDPDHRTGRPGADRVPGHL